jgi:hypothetical protein
MFHAMLYQHYTVTIKHDVWLRSADAGVIKRSLQQAYRRCDGDSSGFATDCAS